MNKENMLLRLKMCEKGLTQSDLAARIDISKTSMSRKINGDSEFTVKEAINICDALNCSPCDIFFT